METIEVISTDKATVFIQVNPQADQDSTIFVDGQKATSHNAALKVFFKAQPKALGTVQIMIGVVIFFLGFLLTISYPDIVISGIIYCGSFIYIIAGSLSVAAQNKINLCVVKAFLVMNVISAITAGLTIILLSIVLIISVGHPRLYPEVDIKGEGDAIALCLSLRSQALVSYKLEKIFKTSSISYRVWRYDTAASPRASGSGQEQRL
ncbi:membrane-spanning 4-domains subfamily A member 5-like [Chanodichthys erythropterus]|uniref:membrane-spanning 4-domains subfamily A member 5-like n=1 Tax=Chanodichthys erythropterus TaxID=933992 RepID=UPI00351E0BA0